MSRIKSTLLLIASSALLSVAIELVIERKMHLIHLVNNLFMVSLALILIGLSLFVVTGGFFDLFSRTFKKYLKTLSKSSEYAAEHKPESNFNLSERVPEEFTSPLLIAGFILFILTTVVAYSL